MRSHCAMLAALSLAVACMGADAPKMTPITKLEDAPPNTWVRIGGQDFGVRKGSALFWSEATAKYVLAQGVSGDAKRKIALPYDVQVFDPNTAVWENHFPPGKEGVWGERTGAVTVPGYPLSSTYFHIKDKEGNVRPNPRQGFPNGFAVDANGSGLYLYARGYKRLIGVKPGAIWRYDVKKRAWSEVCPEHILDEPSHGGPPNIVGARVVHGPVQKMLLLLGGQAPNVAEGTVGPLAFSLERKRWGVPDNPADLLAAIRSGPALGPEGHAHMAAWRLLRTANLARRAYYGGEDYAVQDTVSVHANTAREHLTEMLKGTKAKGNASTQARTSRRGRSQTP